MRSAPDAVRLAAQKAFFQAALGSQAAPVSPAQAPLAAAPRATPTVLETIVRAIPEDAPTQIPGPGSFLNILV